MWKEGGGGGATKNEHFVKSKIAADINGALKISAPNSPEGQENNDFQKIYPLHTL